MTGAESRTQESRSIPFPGGQFVIEHVASSAVAGAHFTLLLNMMHFHVDDSWEALTAGGSIRVRSGEGAAPHGVTHAWRET